MLNVIVPSVCFWGWCKEQCQKSHSLVTVLTLGMPVRVWLCLSHPPRLLRLSPKVENSFPVHTENWLHFWVSWVVSTFWVSLVTKESLGSSVLTWWPTPAVYCKFRLACLGTYAHFTARFTVFLSSLISFTAYLKI